MVARDVGEALAALRADPKSELLAGGTDLMVEVNFGRKRVENVIALDRVDELRQFDIASRVRVGGGITYTHLLRASAGSVALSEASRTVGSPQIRNVGTIGGNVATSSPAGDTLPVLAALDASITLRSSSGERHVPFGEFMTGPKRNTRAHDEIVVALEWDDAGRSQAFLKVGTRNAMVIAVASLPLVVDRARRRVGVALGSCGPTIIRAADAERFATGLFDESGWTRELRLEPSAQTEFGRLVGAAARPIDDVRGTAAYRRQVLSVIGGRALARVGLIA
jgi:CO/xanthine dehydrogenase FAD-binding subunit